jgi:hypothetical protein
LRQSFNIGAFNVAKSIDKRIERSEMQKNHNFPISALAEITSQFFYPQRALLTASVNIIVEKPQYFQPRGQNTTIHNKYLSLNSEKVLSPIKANNAHLD